MNYKVPGIYSSHQIAFPPLSGRLEPGIPAILGYTEKAEVAKGVSLAFVPTLLNTWEAFTAQYGGPFPIKAHVGYDPQGRILLSKHLERRFLWESVRLFFENGGREIYIVSIGDYQAVPDRKDFERGLDALRAHEEPSHVLMPDAVLLGTVDCGMLQASTLQHCADHKHRFAILDLVELHSVEATVDSFRANLNSQRLDLGAAYYPWIRTGHKLEILPENISYSQIVYREPREMGKANVPIYNASFDQDWEEWPKDKAMLSGKANVPILNASDAQDWEEWPKDKAMLTREANVPILNASDAQDWEEVVKQQVIIGLRENKGSLRNTENFPVLLSHLKSLKDQLTLNQEKTLEQDLANYLGLGRAIVLGFASLSLLASLPIELAALTETQRKSNTIRAAITTLVTNELNPDVAAAIRRKGRAEEDFKWLSEGIVNWMDAWPSGVVSVEPTITKAKPPVEGQVMEARDQPKEFVPDAKSPSLGLAEVVAKVLGDKGLFNAMNSLAKGYDGLIALARKLPKPDPKPIPDPVPDSVKAAALERLSGLTAWLPPSGAVAGLYAATDRERGTFKAPANASLRAVLDVGHRLTLPQQEDMNASPTGKAVNALLIRTGRGIVVNASRTCDANSREWRYVPVRRYFLAFEKAVRDRMIDYVFHTNDANLWENVRGMLTGFCLQQFKSGALAGKNADEAFFVQVGQGETLTDMDILEGRLIVQIGLAVARPAEFIVLTFVHHMESDRMSIQS